jgi:hypothetical protein
MHPPTAAGAWLLQEWVEQIMRAWVRCVKHTARGTHSPGADELLAMREAKWRAENEALRKSLAEAEAGRQQEAERSGEQWRSVTWQGSSTQ